MSDDTKYYIVAKKALPEVLKRTVEAKRYLIKGEVPNIGEAIKRAGLSRSAFYKYRALVSPLSDAAGNKIVTFQATLSDEPGILAGLLNLFTDYGTNILTINQAIPVSGRAAVTVSVRTSNMRGDIETLIKTALNQKGVMKLEILANE